MNVTICLLLFCLCAMGDHSHASIVESNKYTQQSLDPLVGFISHVWRIRLENQAKLYKHCPY